MNKKIFTIALALAVTMISGPSQAQYGRLVASQTLLTLFATACTATAPDFARGVPPIAKSRKWDELGRTPSARPGDRGWLISLGGLPGIVDIAKPDATTQTCSASSVSDPAQVVTAISRLLHSSPNASRDQQGRHIQMWSPTNRFPYKVMVTSAAGQAMTRITMTSIIRR